MAIVVRRRSNMSADQLLVAFNKQSSRNVKVLRKTKYFARNQSSLKVKIGALKREQYRAVKKQRQFYDN